MNHYQGIDPKDLWLLSEVRFQNSKAFYEEKKPQIKEKILNPIADLITDLSEDFLKLDPMILTNPKKMISRVRRDTRFSKDKMMYRENLWFCFMRPKTTWPVIPAMWFEIEPDGYTYGVGCWGQTPGWMEQFRRHLLAQPQRFREAYETLCKAGFTLDGEDYKKAKPGDPPEDLAPCYQKRYISFLTKNPDLQELKSPELPDCLRDKYRKAQAMYYFLADVSEQYAQQLIG